jgi:hypothetical protein
MKCVYIIQTGHKRGQANSTHVFIGTLGGKRNFESIAQKLRGKTSDAGLAHRLMVQDCLSAVPLDLITVSFTYKQKINTAN